MSIFENASGVSAPHSSFSIFHGGQTNNLYVGHGEAPNQIHELHSTSSSKDDDSPHVIANWLSSLDFRERQSDILEKRTEGTGEWLSKSQPFRDWLAGKSRILWCSGIRERPFYTDYIA